MFRIFRGRHIICGSSIGLSRNFRHVWWAWSGRFSWSRRSIRSTARFVAPEQAIALAAVGHFVCYDDACNDRWGYSKDGVLEARAAVNVMVAWLASETNRNNAEGGETRNPRMWQLEDSQFTH
jgi:hypothetical protein